MSVSPAQNVLNPSPVPGPVTVKLKSGFDSLISSATAVEIGSTVDEPETVIVPLMPVPAGDPPSTAGGEELPTVGAVAPEGAVGLAVEEHAVAMTAADSPRMSIRLDTVIVTLV